MTSPDKCPFCGLPSVAPGRIVHPGALFNPVFELDRTVAKPGFMDILSSNSTPIADAAFMCLSCGTIWTTCDPELLRELVERRGSAEYKDKLASLDAPPPLQ